MPTISLPSSSRKLSYRDIGSVSEGFPIFFNHGNCNSSLFDPCWEKTEEITRSVGARVIAVDRPGVGDSTFYVRDGYLSWANDVRELADHLGIFNFGVAGFSSGGPNALAVAAALPHRVKAVGLFSSDAPYFAIGDDMLRKMKYPARDEERLSLEMCEKLAAITVSNLETTYKSIPKENRQTVALEDLRNATKQGLKGVAMDFVLETSEWNFKLADVKQPVVMWHGTSDDLIPVEAAKQMEQMLPDARATYVDGEGHTLVRRHWKTVLETVISIAKVAPASRL